MCLIELYCGMDLGILCMKVEFNVDGFYSIIGNKIFILAGDYDMVDNIIYIVLVCLLDVFKGIKGIFLFIVFKVNVGEDGILGEVNGVICGFIEYKMGIKVLVICVLNFEGVKGYLIGFFNCGLNCMFIFMNIVCIGIVLQGVLVVEGLFQGVLVYVKDCLVMCLLSGFKVLDKEVDLIIVYLDVCCMLLIQKVFVEGGCVMLYYLFMQGDVVEYVEDEEVKKLVDDLMVFLILIVKVFCIEVGLEVVNYGV